MQRNEHNKKSCYPFCCTSDNCTKCTICADAEFKIVFSQQIIPALDFHTNWYQLQNSLSPFPINYLVSRNKNNVTQYFSDNIQIQRFHSAFFCRYI